MLICTTIMLIFYPAIFCLRPPIEKKITSDNDLDNFFSINAYDDVLVDGNANDYDQVNTNISANNNNNNNVNELRCHYQHAIQQFFEKLLEEYDNNLLPKSNRNKVELEVHVQEISEVSESRSSFVLDLFVSEIWTDQRLAFDKHQVCRSNITIKTEFRSRIWSPGTCMINTKQATLHKSPSDNAFFIIYSTGTVWQNHRMQVRGPCDIDLRAFPFDIQQCFISFETSSYNFQEIELMWYHEPLTLIWHGHLPDFYLHHTQLGKSRVEYPNGIWDQLEMKFVFKRKYGFYLTQCYFPTALTVIVSWLTFYLESRAVSARVTLSVSALLALTFQFGNVLNHLPRVSYIKCIDVWMIACCLFVFFAMVELAMACHFTRRQINFKANGRQSLKTRWFEMTWLDKKKLNLRKKTPVIAAKEVVQQLPSQSSQNEVSRCLTPSDDKTSGFLDIGRRFRSYDAEKRKKKKSESLEDKVMAIRNKVTGEVILVGLEESDPLNPKKSKPTMDQESSLYKSFTGKKSIDDQNPAFASTIDVQKTGPLLFKYLPDLDKNVSIRSTLTPESCRPSGGTGLLARCSSMLQQQQSLDGESGSGGGRCLYATLRFPIWISDKIRDAWDDWRSFRMTADRLDRLSRMAFPIAFLIFNILYWCVYVFLS